MLSQFDIPDGYGSAPEGNAPACAEGVQPDLRAAYIHEAALDFFNDNQLPELLGLTPEQHAALKADPQVQEEVLAAARAMRSSGEAFRKASSRFAESLLPEVAQVATDPDAKPGERLKAVELLASWGGHAPKNAPQVAVQVNLQSLLDDASARRASVLADRSYLESDG